MKSISKKAISYLLTALFLVLASTPAYAQSNDDLAVEHFDTGARLFYEGDFSGAIVEFRKAYDYNPDPMILYNISLAHERLGNLTEALRIGKTAAQNPALPPPVAVRNDARLAAFAIAIASETITTRTAAEARNAALAAGLKPGFAGPQDAPPIWNRLTRGGWTGVAIAGAGVVLLTYSGIVNYGLSADIARYQTTPDPQEYNRLKQDITDRSRRGRIALYSGATLAAIGAGLLTFDLLYDRSSNSDTPPNTNTETNTDTDTKPSVDDLLFDQKATLNIGISPASPENLIQLSGTF